MNLESKRLLLCALCVATLALTGCRVFRDSCEKPPVGEEVAVIAPLKTPDGIVAPDTRNALKIPEVATADVPRAKADPCLEAPPTYSPGWKPDENAKEVKPGDVPEPERPKKKRRWWPFGRG